MANPIKRCETCAAFCAFPEPQCRRDAPKLFSAAANGQLKVFGTWPPTTKDDWCLQWIAGVEARETAQ